MSRTFDPATFGVWYAENGNAFTFKRWLKESEVDYSASLTVAAQRYLDGGGPRGSELEPGRYMVQRVNRGVAGALLQALTFDAAAAPAPLKVRIPK